MVEQRDRESDAFHEAVQVCSEEMTEHTRKVLYFEQCYRAVCAGEMLSWQVQLISVKLSWRHAHAHLCLPRSASEHAGYAVALNKWEQEQKRSNNKMVKMHIQHCKNIVLGNCY